MSQMSTQVAARREWALLICNVGRVHGPTATTKLAPELDGLEGFNGTQTLPFVLASCALLERVTEEMWDAEYHYTQEQTEDIIARDDRDENYAQAMAGYLAVRSSVSNVLGNQGLKIYAIPTRQPETATKLMAAMHNTIQLLAKNPRQKSDGFGNTFDSTQAKAGLEAMLAPLTASLDLMRTENKETEQAMLNRNATVTRWERVYRGTANMLTGLFTMAEMPELAERVRPTIRRSAGLDAPGDEETSDITAPSGDTPQVADTPAIVLAEG